MGRLDAVLHVAGFPLQPAAGRRVPWPGRAEMKRSMEATIHHFKHAALPRRRGHRMNG